MADSNKLFSSSAETMVVGREQSQQQTEDNVPTWVRAIDAVLAYAQYEKQVEALTKNPGTIIKAERAGIDDNVKRWLSIGSDAMQVEEDALAQRCSAMSVGSGSSSPKRARLMSCGSAISSSGSGMLSSSNNSETSSEGIAECKIDARQPTAKRHESLSPRKRARPQEAGPGSRKIQQPNGKHQVQGSSGAETEGGSARTKTPAKGGSGKNVGQRWTTKQDDQLRQAVRKFNESNWKAIAEMVEGRNHVQCLQRWKKVLQPGLVKGLWTKEEDVLLVRLMAQFGQDQKKHWENWAKIAEHVPGRSAKQCRERWRLNLDPSINRDPWTPAEDKLLLQLHAKVGNSWAEIKRDLPGRTENAVKSRYKSIVRAHEKLRGQEQQP